MTIITKAITEKKADEKEQPVFVEENAVENGKRDAEAQDLKSVKGPYFVSRKSIYRIHVTSTFLLFLVALMIFIIGVIGGLYLYRQYAQTQMHRFRTGWYSIPYDNTDKLPYTRDAVHQSFIANSDLILKSLTKATEQEAVDIEKNNEIKIDVPDFRGGRQGRFIHDFNVSKTGIIDIDGQCCFVMPLNRQTVLPPRNMYDLLRKMYNGYYEVNTEIVRQTMKVVTPPITDLSVLGTYIARECQDLPTYMLTEVNSNVVKRSISSGVFGQFAGKNIIEFDILNLDDVDIYKKSSQD
ncbi:Integral membrane protein 2B [Habropoda laboriosa]|uniref:Integral membrane protein 2 n=1 Tax=Habropoda laboriosa TaxID=597456 RepID=A0A0L7QWC7_9HYME|nr:PREDICTED: integral membrane protein 2B [Habropoda laboriosa]KOC62938.1 Integral membrane protein 2B [Habropoda laboriosa]